MSWACREEGGALGLVDGTLPTRQDQTLPQSQSTGARLHSTKRTISLAALVKAVRAARDRRSWAACCD